MNSHVTPSGTWPTRMATCSGGREVVFVLFFWSCCWLVNFSASSLAQSAFTCGPFLQFPVNWSVRGSSLAADSSTPQLNQYINTGEVCIAWDTSFIALAFGKLGVGVVTFDHCEQEQLLTLAEMIVCLSQAVVLVEWEPNENCFWCFGSS